MRRFLLGNVFLLISILSAMGSQVLLKALIDELQSSAPDWRDWIGALDGGRWLRLAASLLLLVCGYASWVLSLVRLDLSYAYPVACSSVLLVVLFSALVLREPVTPKIWLGATLVVVGIILLAPRQGG